RDPAGPARASWAGLPHPGDRSGGALNGRGSGRRPVRSPAVPARLLRPGRSVAVLARRTVAADGRRRRAEVPAERLVDGVDVLQRLESAALRHLDDEVVGDGVAVLVELDR